MLEKSMYDSWASRIHLFIKGKKNGRMMLDSIDIGPLVYPTVEENGQTRPKNTMNSRKHNNFKMTVMFKKQISFFTVLHPMSPIHHQHHHTPVNPQQQSVSPQPFISLLVTLQSQAKFPRLDSSPAVLTFQQGDDPIECINKAMTIPQNSTFQTEDLDAYNSDCDDISSAKAVLMANLLSYDPDVLSESVENSNLNAQLQEKVFAIASLKNELRKFKGKNVIDTTVSKPSATIAQGMFKLHIKPISRRLNNNRDTHEVYLEKTIENTDIHRGLVECARKHNPSKPLLESACMFTKYVQELLLYVSKTCLSLTKPCEKLVVVTPMNKDKKVRFAEPVTSLSKIPKQTDSLKTKDSNKPLLTSTGVTPTTSASGSKPFENTKNNKISRQPSSNQKNKVEEHPSKVKSSFNKMNSIFEPISNVHVKHSMRNAKVESIYAICNKCLFDANYDIFGNDHIAKIMGYEDYQMGNVTISRVYYVEGLGHNLFSMEALATVCYTQNRSLIQKRHNKTPYELIHDRKHELSYLYVLGALFYPTNDSEDLGKLKPKADIGIFIGYAPAKKAFQIYNKRTQMIIETIHVDFDELTVMASEQCISGPEPKLILGTISSVLMLNIHLLTSYVPPIKND
nr:retrovirus-related Pol polyprotein from transposon TNT 1-94 [Tanacetum cinerariifolium]